MIWWNIPAKTQMAFNAGRRSPMAGFSGLRIMSGTPSVPPLANPVAKSSQTDFSVAGDLSSALARQDAMEPGIKSRVGAGSAGTFKRVEPGSLVKGYAKGGVVGLRRRQGYQVGGIIKAGKKLLDIGKKVGDPRAWLSPKTTAGFGAATGAAAGGAQAAEQSTGVGLRDLYEGLPGTNTTENYRKRFGMDPNISTLGGDIAARGLGFASDVGAGIVDAWGQLPQMVGAAPEGFEFDTGKQLFRDQQEYAGGGMVGYERGGKVGKGKVKLALETAAQVAKRTGLRTPTAADAKAAQAARMAPQSVELPKAKPVKAKLEKLKPPAPRQLTQLPEPTGVQGLRVEPKPGTKTIEAPEMKGVNEPGPKVAIGSKYKPPKAPDLVAAEAPSGLQRAKNFIITKLGGTPVTPAQAGKAAEKIAAKSGPGILRKGAGLVAATALAAPAYKAIKGLVSGQPAFPEASEALADEAASFSGEAPPPREAPTPAAAPVSPGAGPATSDFLAGQGLTAEDEARPPVPEGLRGTIMRGARPDPGAFINFGDYGGNANIYGTASTPGGRVNKFVGEGTGAGMSPERQAQYNEGLRRAQAEKDELTGIVAARTASGAPEDLEAARGLAVSPEQKMLVAEADRYRQLKMNAGSPLGVKRLLEYEQSLRNRATRDPQMQLELLKLMQGSQQKAFENRLAAQREQREGATAAANIDKIRGEVGDAAFKRLTTTIDQVAPPTINGKTNPHNAAFKEVLMREMAQRGVDFNKVSPQVVAALKRDYDKYAALQPGLIDRVLDTFGVGTAVAPSRISDVRPIGIREGALEPQVITPIGTQSLSRFRAIPGAGVNVPLGPNIGGGSTADAVRWVEEQRRRQAAGLRGAQ